MDVEKQCSNRHNERTSRCASDSAVGDKGRVIRITMAGLGLAALVGTAHDIGNAIQLTDSSSGEERPLYHVVTGTLDQLDFESHKGMLKTDLGKPLFFEIVQPELFRRLSVGQRVTIGMNEQGQAVKVMEVPPIELPHPPTSGQ